MAITLKQITTALNATAAIAATLQATGVLNLLGPTGLAIAGAILAGLNEVVHQLNATAPAADAPK